MHVVFTFLDSPIIGPVLAPSNCRLRCRRDIHRLRGHMTRNLAFGQSVPPFTSTYLPTYNHHQASFPADEDGHAMSNRTFPTIEGFTIRNKIGDGGFSK